MAQPYIAVSNANVVVRAADGAFVPMDMSNTDYQHYRVWVAQGGIPDNWSLFNVLDATFNNNLLTGLL
jgi:hypothetical protein